MEDKECTYIYTRGGTEFVTPSLEKAIERTDTKTIKAKCSGDKTYKIIEIS